MSIRFSKPPLVQAVCELRFTPNSPWDLTIPGLFYEHGQWKDEFPHREQQAHNELQWDQKPNQMAFGMVPEVRVMLSNKTRNRSITLGTNLMIITATPPYGDWVEFRGLIKKSLDDYCAVASPKGLARVGLRYINAITPAEGMHNIENYTTTWPRIPLERTKNQKWGIWAQRVEVARPDIKGLLIIQTGTNFPKGGNLDSPPPIILDFDAISHIVALADLPTWLEDAHDAIEETFLESITSQARQEFEEEAI